MALSFPLAKSEFMDLLPVASETIHPGTQRQNSGTEGGEILTAEVAPPLWGGMVSLHALGGDCAAKIRSRLAALQNSGGTFHFYSRTRPSPQDSTSLGGSTVRISSVSSPSLALKGLPAGFVIHEGDFLSFSYDSGRVAYHMAAETATANGSGITPAFEVTPPPRTGAVADLVVTLEKAICKAVIVPGSVSYGSAAQRWVDGASFEWRQTLR